MKLVRNIFVFDIVIIWAALCLHAHPHPNRKSETSSPQGPGQGQGQAQAQAQAGRHRRGSGQNPQPTACQPSMRSIGRLAAAAHRYPPLPPALFSLASPASCSCSSSSLHSPPNFLSLRPLLLFSSHHTTSLPPSAARVQC